MERFIIIITFFIVAMLIGGFALEYDIEFWMPYIVNHAVDVPFGVCMIGGIFLSQFAIPIAILTWIISFII